jgi:Ankyrin repeats (3 copies)/AAA ATPase domain
VLTLLSCTPSDWSVTSCPSITSIGPLGHISSCRSHISKSENIDLSKEYEALDAIDLVWNNEELMKWLNAAPMDTTNPILYITGSAGAGKSAICSKIVDYLQKYRRAGEIIVHYFADGRFANSNLAIDILRTTMMELIWRSPLAKRNDIKTLLSNLLSARLSLSRSQIRDFLQRIKHSVSSEETLYFVLDGLDDVEESQHAIDFLNEILDLGNTYDRRHPVKVLVSSKLSFLRKENLQGAFFLDIDKVTSNWRNRLWTLQERILSQATGITSLTVLHSIKDLPQDLPDVYRYTIGRISKQYQAIALQMLRWVAYAARPLCTRELLGAISLQMSVALAETDILGICRGLLSIGGDGTVNLVHLSLRNYLQSQSDNNDILGWRAVSAATHEMITHTCFQILGKSMAVVDLPDVVKDERFLAFWGYAAENWRFHYSYAERQSTYLPGMLHERLINIWEVSDGIFGQESAPNSSTLGEESPKATNTSSIAFLNAALAEGARSGMPRLIRLELEMGADPNAADNFGNTPLHHAAAAGNVEAVRLLIDYGANVNVASNSGNTPLSYAVSNRRLEVVKLLLTHPSNPFGKHLEIHEDEKECGSPQYACQKLSLVALLSYSCSDCGVVQSNFFVSPLSFLKSISIVSTLASITFRCRGIST